MASTKAANLTGENVTRARFDAPSQITARCLLVGTSVVCLDTDRTAETQEYYRIIEVANQEDPTTSTKSIFVREIITLATTTPTGGPGAAPVPAQTITSTYSANGASTDGFEIKPGQTKMYFLRSKTMRLCAVASAIDTKVGVEIEDQPIPDAPIP